MPSYEYLYNAYVVEKKSQYEIALECYCSQGTVSNWLIRLGIPARHGRRPLTEEKVNTIKEMLAKGMEIRDICAEVHSSPSTVLRIKRDFT